MTLFVNIFKSYIFLFQRVSIIVLAVLTFANVQNAASQNLKSDVSLGFVVDSATIKAAELHFNTLRISNQSARPYTGSVQFSVPDGWRVIAFNTPAITILPGDTVFVPFRVAANPDATGAVSYLVHATFRSGDYSVMATSYLTVPPVSKWDFASSGAAAFITENYPYSSFNLKLTNKGNTPELIRVDYKLGKLLTFRSDIENHSPVEYVSLAPFKDTLITRAIALRSDLSYSEKLRYERNWKESSVMLTASTESERRSSEIQIKKLSSSYHHVRAQSSSPLNVDYNVYNLMSNQLPRHNLMLYGNVLFDHDIDVRYNLGVHNVGIYEGAPFDFNRQFVYNVNFTDLRNEILLSYNNHSSGLHSVSGRGISGKFRINDLHRVNYSIIQNPFTNDWGFGAGYDTRIKNISVNTQVTQEINAVNGYRATSLQGGAGFSFLKYHRLNLQLLGSMASYRLAPGRDTTALGMSFRFNYFVKYKNFDLKFNGMNTALNKIKNAGNQQYYLDGSYKIKDNLRVILYANSLSNAITRYPYNFSNPKTVNSTQYIRSVLAYADGNVTYQAGPNYIGSKRNSINSITGYTTTFNTYQPGVWGAVSFRFDGYRSVSPNVTIGNMTVKYNNSNPAIQPVTINAGLAYSVGVNYFDDKFKLNAYYSSGSAGDLYRDFQVYEQPTLTRTLQIRPSYEEYLFNRTAKVNAYVNYTYYLPSERQNVAYNIRYEQSFKKSWSAYVSGHVFTNSRKDEDGGRLNTMDMNFVAGIRKSFDIQQPRIKYYDLKTVFFNDLNGDRLKSDNEPPVSNILVKMSGVRSDSMKVISQVPEIELVSNVKGEINIENLPRTEYKMVYQPLVNLQSYYFLNGSEQAYVSDKDRVLYVPLVESYKIIGKINLVRDPNSREGKLDVDGIRVLATSTNGEVYSVLTDRFGNYILNVPNSDKYLVKITNVFGEYFTLDKDEVLIQFGTNKTINLDFTFVERKREINFNNGNQIFKFNTSE